MKLFSLGIQIQEEENIYLNILSRLFPVGYGWLSSKELGKDLLCVPSPSLFCYNTGVEIQGLILINVRGAYHYVLGGLVVPFHSSFFF